MIREAKIADLGILLTLSAGIVEGSGYPYATISPTKLAELLCCKDVKYWFAFKGDEPIGFIGVMIEPFFFSDELRASDVGFFIKKEHRGGSSALRLLNVAKDWAMQRNVRQFFIGQNVGNKVDSTRSFYERNGFEVCGFNAILNFK